MMQGDARYEGIEILNNAKSPVTPEDVIDVEVAIGPLIRSYRKGEVLYDEGMWYLPLTQEDTFGLWPATPKAQVRLYWANGVIEGLPMYLGPVNESMSKEVL